ncbi:MAG: GumC family protein [Terriglobales bacterium]
MSFTASARTSGPELHALLIRRRWWFLLPLLAGWLAVVSLRWVLPPDYQSQSLLLMQRQAVPTVYVQPNVTFNPDQMLQSMGLEVLSRDRLAQVVREHNLYPALQRSRGMDAAIAELQQQIAIAPVDLASLPHPPAGDWSAVSIAYTAPTPALAQVVDNDLTTSFIQQNLRATQQASSDTTSFLKQQLQQASDALGQAQLAVENFERGHLGSLPGQGPANLALVMNLQTEASAGLSALNHTQQEIATDRALVTHAPTPGDLDRQQQLQTLEAQLSQMRSRYTERYPGIVSLQQQIAVLQAKQAAHPVGEAGNSLALAQANSQLQADEALLPQQQKQVAQLNRDLGRYQQRLTGAPLPASQLAALETTEQQAQVAYQSLLGKWNSSRMASELAAQQGGAQFQLVNAPSWPREPSWPKPSELSLLGLLVGACLGLGACVVGECIDDRIATEGDLAVVGLAPVLIRVPRLCSARQRKRQQFRALVQWVAVSVALLLLLAGNLWLWRLGG